jgi:acyl carrier protein
MASTPERVKSCIVSRLELGIDPASIADDKQLFAPTDAGGMELDSLAAIEIVVGLSKEFGVQLDDMPREAFQSVGTLSSYLDAISTQASPALSP